MNNAFYSNKFYTKDSDLFLNLSTDILNIAQALNKYKDDDGIYVIKRLLVNINEDPIGNTKNLINMYKKWEGFKIASGGTVAPLSDYNEDDELMEAEEKANLVDALICTTPMIPSRDNSREMGSYISINMLENDLTAGKNSSQTTIAIDTWTPPQQWMIAGGIRPYVLCSHINNVMTNIFRQENGVKYRLVQVINAKLSDDLLGFRMVYESVLED